MTLPSGIYQLMAPRAHKTRSIHITEEEFTSLIKALQKFLDIVLDPSTYKIYLLQALLEIMKPSRDVTEKITPVARLTKLLGQIDEVTNLSLHKNIAKPDILDKRHITLDDLIQLFTDEQLLHKANWINLISDNGDNRMYVGEKTLVNDNLVKSSDGNVELKHGNKTLGQEEVDDVIQESTDLAGKEKSTDKDTEPWLTDKHRGNASRLQSRYDICKDNFDSDDENNRYSAFLSKDDENDEAETEDTRTVNIISKHKEECATLRDECKKIKESIHNSKQKDECTAILEACKEIKESISERARDKGNNMVKHISTQSDDIIQKNKKEMAKMQDEVTLEIERAKGEYEYYKNDLNEFYKLVRDTTGSMLQKRQKELKSIKDNFTAIDFVAKMVEIQNYEEDVLLKCKDEIHPIATMAESNQNLITDLQKEVKELKELVAKLTAGNGTTRTGQFSHVNLDGAGHTPSAQSFSQGSRNSANQTTFHGISHPLPQYTKVRIKHHNRVIEHLSLVQCKELNHYTTASRYGNEFRYLYQAESNSGVRYEVESPNIILADTEAAIGFPPDYMPVEQFERSPAYLPPAATTPNFPHPLSPPRSTTRSTRSTPITPLRHGHDHNGDDDDSYHSNTHRYDWTYVRHDKINSLLDGWTLDPLKPNDDLMTWYNHLQVQISHLNVNILPYAMLTNSKDGIIKKSQDVHPTSYGKLVETYKQFFYSLFMIGQKKLFHSSYNTILSSIKEESATGDGLKIIHKLLERNGPASFRVTSVFSDPVSRLTLPTMAGNTFTDFKIELMRYSDENSNVTQLDLLQIIHKNIKDIDDFQLLTEKIEEETKRMKRINTDRPSAQFTLANIGETLLHLYGDAADVVLGIRGKVAGPAHPTIRSLRDRPNTRQRSKSRDSYSRDNKNGSNEDDVAKKPCKACGKYHLNKDGEPCRALQILPVLEYIDRLSATQRSKLLQELKKNANAVHEKYLAKRAARSNVRKRINVLAKSVDGDRFNEELDQTLAMARDLDPDLDFFNPSGDDAFITDEPELDFTDVDF